MYQRLKKRKDFLYLKKNGFKFVTRHFILFFDHNRPESDVSRLGVIASRKTIGGAVKRNRAKRRLRSVFYLCFDSSLNSCDYVLVSRASLLKASFCSLKEDMERGFNLIRKKNGRTE